MSAPIEKEFTINELYEIQQAVATLTCCPQVSFELSVKINEIRKPVSKVLKDFEEKRSIAIERLNTAKEAAKKDQDKIVAAEDKFNKEINELTASSKKKKVPIVALAFSEFRELNIAGSKMVHRDGLPSVENHYRDALFALMNYECIV